MLAFQTIDPLKAMSMGTPLEDARGLAQRYSRMRHEAEILVCELVLIIVTSLLACTLILLVCATVC